MTDFAAKAAHLEAQKQYAEAAALWEHLFELDRAVECHRKAGDMARAATLLENGGRGVEAAGLYAAAGQLTKAATLYETGRRYELAARCYLNAKQRDRAALMYEEAGARADAAKVYASIGNVAKAVQLYEQAGLTAEAARLRSERSEALAAPSAPAADLDAMLAAPDIGLDEAGLVRLLVSALEQGKVEAAAALYARSQGDVGYPLLTAVAGRPELERRLAQLLYAAKDFHKAAQVLESLDMSDKAAVLFERSDDYLRAAECYARAQSFGKAAEMYERGGNLAQAATLYAMQDQSERAAYCFEQTGQHFAAGQHYLKAQRHDRALQVLQQIGAGDVDYLAATGLVADLLVATGHARLAAQRLASLVRERAVDDVTAPLYVKLAELLATHGKPDAARKLLERVQVYRVDYPGVTERLAALAEGTPIAEAPVVTDAEPAAAVAFMDGFDFLKALPLFSELSLDELRAFFAESEPRPFAPGDVLIRRGTAGEALFIVREGLVSVEKEGQVLVRLGAGSPLGEMSLFDDAPTSADVIARAPGRAIVLTRPRFLALMNGNDRLALKIHKAFVRTLTTRLREANERR